MSSLPDHEFYMVLADLTRQQADQETDAYVRRLLDNAVVRYIALAALKKSQQ